MAVRHEIKSQLAKLLATEDLVVEHKNVRTACFNVHTRVLTLPMWEKASNAVYDLLVGHEVGHALFTPDVDWSKTKKLPPSFVNIIEDVRVEKLMKRKYAGLSKTFYKGYGELSDQDFFDLADEDVDSMNLADRVNLYFKIGNFIDVSFTNIEESRIVKLIGDTETFDDVLEAAEQLYAYCKSDQKEQQQVKPNQESPQEGNSGGNDDREWFTESEPEEDERKDSDFNKDNADLDTPSYEHDQNSNEPEVQTDSALEQNIQDLVNDDPYTENSYVEIPELDLDNIIVGYDEYHSYVSNSWVDQDECFSEKCKKYEYSYINIFSDADDSYKKFKKSAQKEVNYLVKEFECKKAADSYARATTSRTGVLDCSKLHTYKYNEDLFKKVTTLSDGKNHGLIFILDWSGSMGTVLMDTVKQLMNLVWFCKKVNIPFDVYAFTNHWAHIKYDEENRPVYPEEHYEKKENIFQVQKDFNLMNILSSKIKNSEFEKCVLNVWRIAYQYTYSVCFNVPPQAGLSGTPLNESIVALYQILPKFQKENNLQKVHCVVLTDGEAHQLNRHVKIDYRYNKEESFIGTRSVAPGSTFLRDRKLGRTYSFGHGYHEFTQTLLNNLRDRFPNVNFIGIRVLAAREANRFMRMYLDGDAYFAAENEWKKNRSFSMKNVGYTTYFGLSANALSQDSEFEVNNSATKAQIKSAFVKSLKSKKMNKKILSEFMTLVA